MAKELSVRQLKITEHIQTRETTDEHHVNHLAERLAAGDTFPAILIVTDGKNRWLCDGKHRIEACKKAGKRVPVDERKGDRGDAVDLAVIANAAHGLKRSNADKRECVQRVLEQYPEASTRQVAEKCGVSRPLVEDMRQVAESATKEKRLGKDRKFQSAKKTKGSKPASAHAKATAKPDKATSFDPEEIEQMPDSKPAKSGRVVNKKPARDLLGKLIRELDSLGLGEQHNGCLDQIARSLK